MKIDKELLDWLDSIHEFNSKSHGIRRCIQISKRVHESDDPKIIMKYWNGIDIKEVE